MSQILWNNTTASAIVLASGAGKTETYAAEELSAYMSKMSGKNFVIADRVRDDKVHVRMIPVLRFGKFNCLSKDLLCIGGHAESCEFLEIILHCVVIKCLLKSFPWLHYYGYSCR